MSDDVTDHPGTGARTLLITGATDGIGLETAKRLAALGHHLLLHGRNSAKLEAARIAVTGIGGSGRVDTHLADLSQLSQVAQLAQDVSNSLAARSTQLDVLINNAGVYKTPQTVTADGLDVRFVVNTLAPCLLATLLMPHMPARARVVNLSSAAQAPVDLRAMAGEVRVGDMEAYAQSKLALTIWSQETGARLGPQGPVLIAVNPGSLLASKMVTEGFGVAGSDLGIGADILVRAALDEAFAAATGKYFDNDAGVFAAPHRAAADPTQADAIVSAIGTAISAHTDTPVGPKGALS
ncbi:MAG: SDR family NAD(P)-dependent oxidoreductase [Pseudomonadota bacterium]